MTRILNITRKDDFHFEITDQRGKVVDGPFDTTAAAWKALERLDNENGNRPPERAKGGKKVLWGKPEKSKKTPRNGRQKPEKMTAKEERKMKVNAAKAPGWIRSVAAVKFDPAGERAFRNHKLGKFGAASEVRRIDPAEYLAEKAAAAKRGS
ncbi:hypothetical protein OIU34_26700 [Pararhizobium sp. BT-229]|uniref:hypothetical protein n=1 Tax=Pararhizobium sp. BT-229 TaxID=2986923 RepID=UPI0021F6E3FA|nr:hypothetical protein [Pararhizobium sp. BT-229]MCV9965473.1 hypothetical protein [Pararhizobium sp. BT-229]